MTVKNFGGSVIAVTVPATARVTTLGLAALATGTIVSVAGEKKPDGSVVATAVTASAGG